MKHLIDYDPIRGISCYFEQNGNEFILHHEQDVEAILDTNKRLANLDNYSKKGIKKGMYHYACIPDILIMKWTKEVGSDILAPHNKKELFKRLNHPDYRYLKTTHGRHKPTN